MKKNLIIIMLLFCVSNLRSSEEISLGLNIDDPEAMNSFQLFKYGELQIPTYFIDEGDKIEVSSPLGQKQLYNLLNSSYKQLSQLPSVYREELDIIEKKIKEIGTSALATGKQKLRKSIAQTSNVNSNSLNVDDFAQVSAYQLFNEETGQIIIPRKLSSKNIKDVSIDNKDGQHLLYDLLIQKYKSLENSPNNEDKLQIIRNYIQLIFNNANNCGNFALLRNIEEAFPEITG
ncbi:MAG: hypothetical protein P4L22_07620 [Candidatus Babeliales bacterium]|nr:hypothetical protein [Candidatus Babeliales bacterium]